jgi:membrane protein DedA with SNARE-associated domain
LLIYTGDLFLNIMPPEVSAFIINYGYLAIFILVFSQEIGIPNPVPNELVLIFSGYLTFTGLLSLPLVVLTCLSADFIGTNILYFVFYFFGRYILQHKPRWLPLSEKRIDKLSKRVTKGGLWTIYFGRITPFIRGYTSVIAGLIQIKPGIFLPIAIISAATWSAICVITGRILGPYWSYAGSKVGNIKYAVLIIITIILLIFITRYFLSRLALKKNSENSAEESI